MKFILIGAGIFAVLFILAGVLSEANKHGIHRLTWRWFSGMPYHGQQITNATWFKHSTKPVDGVIRWHHLPRIHRAGYRTIGTFLTIIIAYGVFKNRDLTIKYLIISTIIVSLIGAIKLIKAGRQWHTDKTYCTPLALALAELMNIPEVSAQRALTIAGNALTVKKGEIGRLILPPKFAANPAQREAIEHLISTRMPVNVDFVWHTATKKMQYLSIMASPRLPKMVKFLDKLKDIYDCAENEVLLGIKADGASKKWDLSSDEPHMLVSANTRRGKTRLAMLIVIQILRRGGHAILIDPKRVGLDEFVAGHPNAVVYSEPRDIENSMWKPIQDFYNILNERIDAYKADRTITFKRELLVIDEISIWAAISKQHWDEIKSGKDKATPPIFYTLTNCLFAGAQFNCNVLIFGQVLGHNVLGNAIEAFGTRLMGGYTKQAYMRLVGITPIPVSQRARGRFLMHDGDDYPEWIQTIYGEIQDMHEFAIEPFRNVAGVPVKNIKTENVDVPIHNVKTEIDDKEKVVNSRIRIVKSGGENVYL